MTTPRNPLILADAVLPSAVELQMTAKLKVALGVPIH